jgi:hypothetical protein
VKYLESGGRAATTIIERLRDVQRRLEVLDVPLEAMILCREEELLAPLLEWGGTGAALRPTVDALEGSLRVPPEADRLADRPPSFRATHASPRQSGWGAAVPVAGARAAMSAPWQEDARSLLNPASAGAQQRAAAILSESTEAVRERERSAAGSPAEPGLHRWPVPELRESQELVLPVTADEARRRLESIFSNDERTTRGWRQPLSAAGGTDLVGAILGESAGVRAKVPGATPVDPMSRRLQSAVDRAMRVREVTRAREIEPSSPSLRIQGSAVEQTAQPVWSPPAAEEQTGTTLAEPPRRSGLRRLASLGESMEPERALSMPTPSLSSSIEEPPRRAGVPLERDDLAREVADIFRREALRHGIVPEEDAP